MEGTDSRETILFAPLNWGLGHSARIVPFIRQAIVEGRKILLASDGPSLDFLRQRFPDVPWVRMPFTKVSYRRDSRFFLALVRQAPGILLSVRRNHRQLAGLVKDHRITRVISDHRYGMWHPEVHSVFITNQLWLPAPKSLRFGEGLAYRLHRFALRKFSEIWIADEPGTPNLSGRLTHPARLPAHARHIGIVSRFEGIKPEKPLNASTFHTLAIVSGPEPQRSVFEELLLQRFRRTGESALILRGLPPANPDMEPAEKWEGHIRLIDDARDEHIAWYLLNAGSIICRPGNSTLSDLHHFKRTATLIPTPGQTEQEYVAGHLTGLGGWNVIRQHQL